MIAGKSEDITFQRKVLRLPVVALGAVLAIAAIAVSVFTLFGNEAPNKAPSAAAVSSAATPTPSKIIVIMPAATPLASGAVRDALLQSSYTDEGIAFDLLLAPPIFFDSVKRPDQGIAVGADKYVVFLLAEHHFHEDSSHGQHFDLMPILKVDGVDIHVARTTIEVSNDGHHRTTALVFEKLPVSMLDESHTWEMILPQDANGERAVLIWTTPIDVEFSPDAGG